MKKNTHNITEQTTERSYKKKYLVRVMQAQEAEEEIREYKQPSVEAGRWDGQAEVPDAQHVDAKRPM
jgi:hypothetical protein